MFIIGGTTDTCLIDPTPIAPKECVWVFDMEASTWHGKSQYPPAATSEPAPWNLVNHSVFKLDSQNLGILWYDLVNEGNSVNRILRATSYNIQRRSWKTIRVTSPSNLEINFRFGAAVVPIYDKHLVLQEQNEMVKKKQSEADCTLPLQKLLILGGINLLEEEVNEQSPKESTFPITVMSFSNAS